MDKPKRQEDMTDEERARHEMAEEWGRQARARLEREWPAIEWAIRAREQRWN